MQEGLSEETTSAVDAAVKAMYVPKSAQPEKKPARGPRVTPERA
ncbi:MAG TPA: hypothetical protein VK902_00395 [Rubrobacter sp.]|nr:hypothetical protein [Rubrobacter sp.]